MFFRRRQNVGRWKSQDASPDMISVHHGSVDGIRLAEKLVRLLDISGIQLFIRAIPYNFYSLLTFVFIITLTLLKFDYGAMRGFEERARNTGDLSGSAGSTEENANPKGRVIDLVIPVIMLIILCTIGMLYVGGFFGADTSGCTDYAGDFIGAFGNTDAFVGSVRCV